MSAACSPLSTGLTWYLQRIVGKTARRVRQLPRTTRSPFSLERFCRRWTVTGARGICGHAKTRDEFAVGPSLQLWHSDWSMSTRGSFRGFEHLSPFPASWVRRSSQQKLLLAVVGEEDIWLRVVSARRALPGRAKKTYGSMHFYSQSTVFEGIWSLATHLKGFCLAFLLWRGFLVGSHKRGPSEASYGRRLERGFMVSVFPHGAIFLWLRPKLHCHLSSWL